MASLRDLKSRIESIKNTRQITNAMKMVAASKLRKSQERIFSARPYASFIDTMLRTLKMKNKASTHLLLNNNRTSAKELVVIFTADKGLCGAFNSGIIRKAQNIIHENPEKEFIIVGKKGFEYLKKDTENIKKSYIGIFNEMKFTESKEIGTLLLDLYMNHNYTKIEVLYNEFKSAIQHDIVLKTILPVKPFESKIVSSTDFIYEPDEDTLIEELGKKFVDVELWRIMLESSAAEQAARMNAMESATENASDLISSLTLQYNRKRQAAITTEIIEISSGASAINQ